MPYIQSKQAGSDPVNIYYEEYGKGANVVFIHGWPLSGSMWEYQVTQLPQLGMRCIVYDRRGFGKSDRPASGYDYNTLAADLKALIDELDLNDVTLVGFSMGGGEIAKYFSQFQGSKVGKCVLISAVTPYMLKTEDHPEGIPKEKFEEMTDSILKDRPAFIEKFNEDFYSVGLMSNAVSKAYLNNASVKAMDASVIATVECARSFALTDFRTDVPQINVPTLIIHGDDDKTVPIAATGARSAEMIKGAEYIVYEGAPHGLWFTEKEKLNNDLAKFILGKSL